MSASIYSEKLVEPDDKMLTYDLAETKPYLDKIAELIENEYGDFTPHFRVAFTFGDKAADLIFNSQLPELIKKELFEAKQYAEGRTIQIEVKTENDLNSIFTPTLH